LVTGFSKVVCLEQATLFHKDHLTMNSLPPPPEDRKSNFISDEDIITLGHYGETVLKFDNLSPHEMILISLVVRMMIGKSFYRCGCLPIDRAIRIAQGSVRTLSDSTMTSSCSFRRRSSEGRGQ
jgi:hypothetical protein